jgi:hypothetical protein
MTTKSNKLSDSELQSFLAELGLDEPSLTNDEIVKLQQEEAALLEELSPGNGLASDDAWGWSKPDDNVRVYVPDVKSVASKTTRHDREKAVAIRHEKVADKKRRRLEIIEEAINSNFIDLNAPLSVAHKKRLISLLTKDYTERMEAHDKYINSTIERTLKLAIPHDLLNTFNLYPDAVAPFPGFTYVASKEYGQGLSFKVYPKIPLYFQPEDCNAIITKLLFRHKRITLDKTVVLFYKHKEARGLREVKLAEILATVHTFFQLVKKDPFWYDLLIQDLKKNTDGL